MSVPLWGWLAFAAVVVVGLAVDLLAHRRDHIIGFREAAAWSGVWVGVSLARTRVFLRLEPEAASGKDVRMVASTGG